MELRKISARIHSRKLVRRLEVGSDGMIECPWSMTFQPSAASWARNGFSTWKYSDIRSGRGGLFDSNADAAGEQVVHETALLRLKFSQLFLQPLNLLVK